MKKTDKKPTFIVNMVDVKNEADVIARVAYAKVKAGCPITEEEFHAVIDVACDDYIDELFGIFNCLVKTTDGIVERLTATKVENKPKIGYWKNLWNAIRGKR